MNKSFFISITKTLIIFLISCNEGKVQNITKSEEKDTSVFKNIPQKNVKLLFLDKENYSSLNNVKDIRKQIKEGVKSGTILFNTFIDSLGNPLSKHYDSVNLDKENINKLIGILKNCPKATKRNFPKCGFHVQDAIVFYDSLNNPQAFISICFGCGVYSFSPSFQASEIMYNTDSLMFKLVDFYNANGLKK